MDEQPKIFEELLKTSRKAKQEDLQFIDAMQRLVVNKDFQVYLSQVIGTRIASLGAQLLEPSTSLDGMIKSEYLKGAMFAFCLARDLPSVMIQSMSELRPAQEESEDNG